MTAGRREGRGKIPASVEGSRESEAGVARAWREESEREQKRRGGSRRANARGRATLLRESRKVASPAAYTSRSFLPSLSFSFLFLRFFPSDATGGAPLCDRSLLLVFSARLLRFLPISFAAGRRSRCRLSLFLPFYPARLDRLAPGRSLFLRSLGYARLSRTHVVHS